MTLPTVAVLVSGRGSNLKALAETAGSHYRVGLVLADRPCGGIDYAVSHGIANEVIRWPDRPDRQRWVQAAVAKIHQTSSVAIACAGFMRILPAEFLYEVAVPVLNIHPSLLPLFRGLSPQRQALAAGVRVSGATVHYVTVELDAGPIIAQQAVPVLPDDDEERLAARILVVEHTLYPQALAAVVAGRCRLVAGKVQWSDAWQEN